MSTLTVTSKGQVTLRKDVLDHLGVQPGLSIDDMYDLAAKGWAGKR
jgi:hypothetical protein